MPANPIAAVLRLAEVDYLIDLLRMTEEITTEQHMIWIRGLSASGLNLRGPGGAPLPEKMQAHLVGLSTAGDVYAVRAWYKSKPVPGAQLLEAAELGAAYTKRVRAMLQELKKASGPR